MKRRREQLARRRRMLGMSQGVLAARIGVDRTTIARWEAGETVPMSWVRPALAQALDVTLDDLDDVLAVSTAFDVVPIGGDASSTPLSSEARSISDVEDLCALLTAYASELPTSAPTDQRLRRASSSVSSAFDAYQDSRFADAARSTAKALTALQSSTAGHDDARSHRLLALAYQVAAAVLTKTGHPELAWVAADRGAHAAQAADSPEVHLSLMRSVAFAMAASGSAGAGLRLIESSATSFQATMSSSTRSASVYGTLLLAGAMISTGANRSTTADTYLDEAAAAASVLGVDANELWTAFGPTNVAIHQVNVAAAASDWDAVLAAAPALDVCRMPIERQVRLHLDVARACTAVGARDDALATLVRAEAAAPQQVRHHRIARDVVTGLISAAPRRGGIELTRLARAVGVPA